MTRFLVLFCLSVGLNAQILSPIMFGVDPDVKTPVDTNSGGSCTGSSGAWTCTGTTTVSFTDASADFIRYTNDGSTTPTFTTGTLFTTGVSTASNTTYKAIGCKVQNRKCGGVLTSVYTISSGDTISFDNSGSVLGGTSQNYSGNYTVNANADGILLCAYTAIDTGGASVSTWTYNSVPLTKIKASGLVSAAYVVEMWALLLPATGTHPVAIGLSGAPEQESNFGCISLTGVHQSLTPDASNYPTMITVGGTPSVSVTPVADNAWLFTAAISNFEGATNTATAPNTSAWAVGVARQSLGSYLGPVTPPGATSAAWTLCCGGSSSWLDYGTSWAPGP